MLEILGAIQRAALQGGVLLIVGAAVWKLLVSKRAFGLLSHPHQDEPGSSRHEVDRRVARTARNVAFALILIWLLRFVLQVAAFRDPFAPLSEDVMFLLQYTIFGPVWIGQGVMILVLTAVLSRLGRDATRQRAGAASPAREEGSSVLWGVVIIGALVLCFTLAMSSHALSVEGNRTIAVAADTLHTLAAGAWLGSLVLILSLRRSSPAGSDAQFAAQLRAFSPIAVASVTILVAMGVYLGWQYVETLSNLWGTTYGRILAAKVAVVGVVMLMGLLNWRRGMPAIDSAEMRAVVSRRAWWEVSVAVVVLLLTGILTGAPRPPESPAEEQMSLSEAAVGAMSPGGLVSQIAISFTPGAGLHP